MSPPPQKIARVDRVSPFRSSPLPRHWPVVRTPLLPFLTTDDHIALLWTCPTLKQDMEIVQRVSDGTLKHVRRFFRGGAGDWCAEVPELYNESWLADDAHDDPASLEETIRAWQAKLGSSERCASLLSLAWLMASELKPLLYSSETPDVTVYTALPFILPLARVKKIARHQPPRAGHPTTALGCHIQNFTSTPQERDVGCALCEALASAHQEAQGYRDRQDAEREAIEQRLRGDGYDSEDDEFELGMDAYYESKAATDELYDEDNFQENLGQVILARIKEGRLPPLEVVGDATEQELNNAVDRNFYDSEFCASHLRPLAAFFRLHGFGRVHHAVLKRSQFKAGDAYDQDEIRRVEMVGAAAPHGFFAGVYYFEQYT